MNRFLQGAAREQRWEFCYHYDPDQGTIWCHQCFEAADQPPRFLTMNVQEPNNKAQAILLENATCMSCQGSLKEE